MIYGAIGVAIAMAVCLQAGLLMRSQKRAAWQLLAMAAAVAVVSVARIHFS